MFWKLSLRIAVCCAFIQVVELKLCLAQSSGSGKQPPGQQHCSAYHSLSNRLFQSHPPASSQCLMSVCWARARCVRCASIQRTQTEFKCWPSLSSLLPKASSVLTTHTLSLNDQSASLEVKREGGHRGRQSPNSHSSLAAWRSAQGVGLLFTTYCSVAVWLLLRKCWTQQEEKIGGSFRHSHHMQYS